jgi:hypothetical protein
MTSLTRLFHNSGNLKAQQALNTLESELSKEIREEIIEQVLMRLL